MSLENLITVSFRITLCIVGGGAESREHLLTRYVAVLHRPKNTRNTLHVGVSESFAQLSISAGSPPALQSHLRHARWLASHRFP